MFKNCIRNEDSEQTFYVQSQCRNLLEVMRTDAKKRGIISPIEEAGSVGSGLRRTTGAQRAEPLQSHSAQKSVLAQRADRSKSSISGGGRYSQPSAPLSAPSPPSVLASSVGKIKPQNGWKCTLWPLSRMRTLAGKHCHVFLSNRDSAINNTFIAHACGDELVERELGPTHT